VSVKRLLSFLPKNEPRLLFALEEKRPLRRLKNRSKL